MGGLAPLPTDLPVTIDGDIATVTFERYGLELYPLFLRAKQLPETQVTYDWERDTYTLTTPARFAARLGVDERLQARTVLPIAEHLFDYQRWVLELALEAKRFAAWLDTGLGKTAVFLEWARQVHALTGGRVLIVAPLAVLPQIAQEWERFYARSIAPIRLTTCDDLDAWLRGAGTDECWLGLTNYEKFIPGVMSELRRLGGLVCDESSLLRTGGGKIKWNIIKSARGIEYKLSSTATPAPNEAMEYASQASFLEKLRSEGEILWTYFSKDGRGNWYIKPHAREAFYQFLSTWSVYLRDPARFGFEDVLKDLPAPKITVERVPITDPQRRWLQETLTTNQVGLWAEEGRVSATVRTKLLQIARGFRYVGKGRERSVERVPAVKPTWVAQTASDEAFDGHRVLIWTTYDEEAEILMELLAPKAFPAVLQGRQKIEQRVAILDDFRAGKFDVLISKPQLIGYGLNLQFVTSMIFSGFDDSFERRYQALRRAVRYGQTKQVRVFMPFVPELEGIVFDNVERKEQRFLAEVAEQEQAYRVALGMVAS